MLFCGIIVDPIAFVPQICFALVKLRSDLLSTECRKSRSRTQRIISCCNGAPHMILIMTFSDALILTVPVSCKKLVVKLHIKIPQLITVVTK